MDNAIRLLTQIGGGAAFNGNQVCGDIRIGIPCTCLATDISGLVPMFRLIYPYPVASGASLLSHAAKRKRNKMRDKYCFIANIGLWVIRK